MNQLIFRIYINDKSYDLIIEDERFLISEIISLIKSLNIEINSSFLEIKISRMIISEVKFKLEDFIKITNLNICNEPSIFLKLINDESKKQLVESISVIFAVWLQQNGVKMLKESEKKILKLPKELLCH